MSQNTYFYLFFCLSLYRAWLGTMTLLLREFNKYQEEYASAREGLIRKANNGDLKAIYRVGYGYYKGKYPARKKDYALAYEYLLMGANKNHARSTFWLGKFFEDKSTGRDSALNAVICYTHASGLKDWDSTMYLASKFWNGEGVEQDYTVAYALYIAAAPLDGSRSYATMNARSTLKKVLSVGELSRAKALGKKLLESKNHFITINDYLNQHGSPMFSKPLLAFSLD